MWYTFLFGITNRLPPLTDPNPPLLRSLPGEPVALSPYPESVRLLLYLLGGGVPTSARARRSLLLLTNSSGNAFDKGSLTATEVFPRPSLVWYIPSMSGQCEWNLRNVVQRQLGKVPGSACAWALCEDNTLDRRL